MNDKGMIIAFIILAVLVVIGAALKIFLIFDSDLPEWMKYYFLFRK